MNRSQGVTMKDLEAIPRAMALAVRPLCTEPTRATYAAFLGVMVHYTKNAAPELALAAAHAGHPLLKSLFERLGAEEKNHYRLAERDLEGLGVELDPRVPPSVQAYRAFWAELAVAEPWKLLGVLYALENVAQFVAADARRGLEALGLRADQSRFVRVHLQADEDHGSAVSECVTRFLEVHGSDILDGARRGAEHWIAMHQSVMAPEAASP